MYPTLSFALEEWFGIQLTLPVQMFGLLVAFAFILAYQVVKHELLRKEKEGLLSSVKQKQKIGVAPSINNLAPSLFIGFLIGYKLTGFATNYSQFSEDPASILLSWDGNWIGGLVGAIIVSYLNYTKLKKEQLPQVKVVTTTLQPFEFTTNIVVIAAAAGIFGAKIFHNLENWDHLIAHPIEALFSFSGLTFYGGLIVAGVSIWWYVKKQGFAPVHVADIAALALTLAYGAGRLGCHISGDGDWGIVAEWAQVPSFLPEWFWQYKYPHNVLTEGVPIAGCTGRFCNELPYAVYPTALWEAIISIAIFVALWFTRKRYSVAGAISGIYLIVMGFERFFIEKIRVNTTYHILDNYITQAEIISVVSILLGVAILAFVYKNKTTFALDKMKERVSNKTKNSSL